MFSLQKTGKFKKDVKLCSKRGYDITDMNTIKINSIAGTKKSIEIIIDDVPNTYPALFRANTQKGNIVAVKFEDSLIPTIFVDNISKLTVDGNSFTNTGKAAIAINELANFRKGGTSSANNGDWVRPADRPAIPVFAENEQSVYWLFGVQEFGLNDYAFQLEMSSGGTYEVDWGDGTVESHISSDKPEHSFDFASIDAPVGSDGYKWVWIKATATSGNFNILDFDTVAPTWRTYSIFVSQVFEIYVQASEVQSINIQNGNLLLLDIFKYLNSNRITSLVTRFVGCRNLKVFEMDTSACTNFSHFLASCTSFNYPLNINTSNGTDFTGFLENSGNFNRSLNNLDFSKTTSMANFLYNGFNFNQPVDFNIPLCTSISNFLFSCVNFNQPVKLTTSNITNFDGFLSGCSAFNQPLNIDTSKAVSMSNFMANCNSFNRKIILDLLSIVSLYNILPNNNSLVGLHLLNMGLVVDTLNLTRTSISIDELMLLFNDLVDRTGNSAGTLTITGTPASVAINTTQTGMFNSKNWNVVL